MRNLLAVLILMMLFATAALGEQPTADQVLKYVDDLINAPQDTSYLMTMKVVEKDGTEKVREMRIWQKGSKRMIKFTKPASDRGIALLSMDASTNFVYLPAYKKVRRVASHVRNQTFMGTDFSQEDMAITRYADDYTPALISSDEAAWELELSRKPGSKISYPKLQLKINKARHTIDRIVYFNNSGKFKQEVRDHYVLHVDKYWCMKQITMTTYKNNHQTVLTMKETTYDQGLTDDFFSQRTLKRPAR